MEKRLWKEKMKGSRGRGIFQKEQEIIVYNTLVEECTLFLKLCHTVQTKITFLIPFTVATDGSSKD